MLDVGQASAGTATSFVTTVPPGACTVTLVGGALSTNFGIGTATTGNGCPLPANGVVTFPSYPGSKGGNLYVIGTAATAIGYIVSTGG